MSLHIPRFSALLIFLVCRACAHVKVVQPVPYGAASLNTNPLEQSGADWPCKQRPGVYDITEWNIMPVNSPQTLRFQGQATHGGGSCQISLTRDTPPTKDSVFKVIKSIEGGCPSTNPGNIGTDPFGYGADTFNFTIPDAIIPANYTLAWTWFNKIGDREMYMNCAPITVTSAHKRRHLYQRHGGALRERTDGLDSLPNMFRANSGNGCSTAQSGTVLAIPAENLGESVQRIGSEPLTPPEGSCGGDNSASVSQDPDAANTSGVSSSISSIRTPTTVSTAIHSSITPAIAQTATPAAPSVSSAVAIPISRTTTGSCPTPGKSICSPDGKAWGTCMENHQVIFQTVAQGTKCDPSLGVEVPI